MYPANSLKEAIANTPPEARDNRPVSVPFSPLFEESRIRREQLLASHLKREAIDPSVDIYRAKTCDD